MENFVCIIKPDANKDWFILCVKRTMFPLSCGNFESVQNSLRRLKRQYKTTHNLQEALYAMSESPVPEPLTEKRYREMYAGQEDDYDYIIERIIEEENTLIREKRKPKKPMLVVQHRKIKETVIKSEKEHTKKPVFKTALKVKVKIKNR